MENWDIPDLISVGIPAYNEEETIVRTLNTVINQDIKIRKEIIVCLNGCTDNTKNIILNYYNSLEPEVKSENEINIKEIKIANKPKAWNIIKNTCSSNLLFFLDADMILNLSSFRLLIETAKYTNKHIAILSGHLKYLSNSLFVNQCYNSLINNKNTIELAKIIIKKYPDKKLKLINIFNNISNNYSERERITGALYLGQKNLLNDIPEDIISEDTFLFRKCLLNNSFKFVKEADAYHLPLKNIRDFLKYRIRAEAGLYQLKDKKVLGKSNLISSWKLFQYIGIKEYLVFPVFSIFILISKILGYYSYKSKKIKVGFEQIKSTKEI